MQNKVDYPAEKQPMLVSSKPMSPETKCPIRTLTLALIIYGLHMV
jgi:hypothetical protein